MKSLIPKDEFGDYLLYLSDNYYSVARNANVLEFGPMNGYHTAAIALQQPNTITCVEPSPRTKFDRFALCNATIIKATANDYYNDRVVRPYDVVTCMGLLYHFHSPLHFIEQVINYSKPKYFIIESVHVTDFKLKYEQVQADGQAFPDQGIENQICYSLLMPTELINSVIESMGYKLAKYELYKDRFQTGPMKGTKNKFGIWMFERINDWRFKLPERTEYNETWGDQ